jgi:hypothetical protein
MSILHNVVQGECLSSLAAKYGVSWKKIYNHPNNSAFRAKRPNPNIICPNDQVYIPDPVLRQEDCAVDQQHEFIVSRTNTRMSVIVQDEMGRALAGKQYKLEIKSVDSPVLSLEGTTDKNGLIEHDIPPDATEGELTVFASGGGYSWTLALGHLDPLEEISGAQHRLHNLGYDTHNAAPGEWDAVSVDALKAFQYAENLPATGRLDATTKNKLKELHD